MSSIDYRVTSLLTEHLGFPPLALIDDIINAVNELLYKCTQAMETYLVEVREKKLQEAADPNSIISQEEIQLGTAKLETLLESQVDKNFDKFELYTLRNIFTIPQDLVKGGWIKLKHHEGIDYHPTSSKQDLDEKIAVTIRNIKLELHLRKILKLQITKAKKIIKALRLFQSNLRFLSQGDGDGEIKMSPKAREALKSLSPIDETLYFLLSQVEELTAQTRALYKKLGGKEETIKGFLPDTRDRYINTRVGGIMKKLGEEVAPSERMEIDSPQLVINSDEPSDTKFLGDLSNISDLDLVKDIGAALNGDESASPVVTEPETAQETNIVAEVAAEALPVDSGSGSPDVAIEDVEENANGHPKDKHEGASDRVDKTFESPELVAPEIAADKPAETEETPESPGADADEKMT